ncbi:MAG: ABC transporter ATP-binding protein [Candidatus Limnocylindrales bacterium]
MSDVARRFGEVVALDGVDLQLRAGEVHAVVGENGAGKTTLMRILAGVERADRGSIEVADHTVTIPDVEAAYRLGIAMVHQHFMLFPSLTVAENLTIGHEPSRWTLFDRDAAEAAVRRLGEAYDLRVDPGARVGDLSVGDLQRVEILRALHRGARVLILDEPTAVLTPHEARGLFRVVRELRANGCTIVFISHKLDEVLEIADRITVLRDGRVTGTLDGPAATAAELARLMVGRELPPFPARAVVAPGSPVLELRDLRGPGISGLDLDVRAGEIVGVAGVAGNGQSELAELVAGLLPPAGGSIRIAGREVTRASVADRREAGLAYVPDDRFRRGLAADASISDNLVMGAHRRPPVARGVLFDRAAAARIGRSLVERAGIRARSVADPARSLSGGNAQRLVLARELDRERPLLVVAQPTRGIDIAATRFVHEGLLSRRAAGVGILLISADLSEVLALADRIVVLFAGRIVGESPGTTADPERLGLWMAGVTSAATDDLATSAGGAV